MSQENLSDVVCKKLCIDMKVKDTVLCFLINDPVIRTKQE